MFRQIKTKIAQKIPRKPRWGRRGIALLVVVGVLSSLFCLPAAALSVTMDVAFSRPPVTDVYAYVEVVYGNFSGGALVVGISRMGQATADDTELRISDVRFDYDTTTQTAEFSYNTASSAVRLFAYAMDKYGYLTPFIYPTMNDYSTCTLDLSSKNGLIGCRAYGLESYYSTSADFAVLYGTDVNTQQLLRQIYSAIVSGSQNTETAVDNANKKAEEREKTETQVSGDKATKDTENAMPSVDSGFANSLKSFVGSMSYNGTQAILPIPKTSIPAIEGVTDEIVLIPEQGYDLSTVITQYIPANLLKLLQHLFDIALVLYCVYELYGLIQYVLTLKKGGKEE